MAGLIAGLVSVVLAGIALILAMGSALISTEKGRMREARAVGIVAGLVALSALYVASHI